MRKAVIVALSLIAALALLTPVVSHATMTNVALGKNVTLNGTFFSGGWGGGLTVSPQTVVDGVFFPRDQQWDQGPVWWDSHSQRGQNMVIDLAGTYSISSLIVEADDNDAYDLFYRKGSADPWHLAWYIPVIPAWGMQTRPNPNDNNQQYVLPAPIVATDLMLTGDYPSDLYYSVSEIQAFGTPLNGNNPVPEPSTVMLAGAGLLALPFVRRKSRK